MAHCGLPHDHGNLPEDLQCRMSGGQMFDAVAEVFKMLGDEKRVQLFWILCHCEECVINLSALVEMSSPAVSHHLKLLKNAGLVISRREGKEVYYTAADTPRTRIFHEMIEHVAEVSCPVEESPVEPQNYDSNIRTITRIHDFLMENIRTRYTIEALSQKFLINQTTLKTTFKSVYGQPIATYMKERRIQQAKELLLHTDGSIACVAGEVGYENQSKFTQAFKELTGTTPKEFRKQARKRERRNAL